MKPSYRLAPPASATPSALRIGVYGFRGVPSTYSGYETFLTVLLPELVARGHEVTAYCRRRKVSREPTFEGVHKSFLPSIDSKELGTLSHGFLSAIVSRFRRHDVLLVVNPANAIYCGMAKFTGQPVALNTDGQEWIRGKWGRAGRAFFKASARHAGSLATALISDSVAMARIYEEEFHSPSTVIPYCWTSLDSAPGTGVLPRLGVRAGEYLCIAGRLIPENNAVAVASAYHRSSHDLPLVVVGTANYDSPVKRALDELAATDSRIRIAGHIDDRAEYADLVRSARVYIHAHSVGGINPSLVEAMGVGASIVAFGTPFNREALGDDGSFFDDFEDGFIAALDRQLSLSPGADEALRSSAQRRALSQFSVTDVVDAVETLLIEISRRRSWRRYRMTTRWDIASRGAEQ